MPGTQQDLEDFLARQPARGGAHSWCCHELTPELREALEGVHAKGVCNWRAMARWLQEQGVQGATPAKIQYHFDRGHHERDTG